MQSNVMKIRPYLFTTENEFSDARPLEPHISEYRIDTL